MFHTKIFRFKCHRFPAVLKLGFRRNYVCKNHRYNNYNNNYNNNNINQFNYSNKNNNKLFCFENTISNLQRRTLSSKGFNALSNNITPPVSRHKHNIIKIVGIGALFLKLLDNFIDENDVKKNNACVLHAIAGEHSSSTKPKVYGKNFLADAVDKAMPSVVHIVVSTNNSIFGGRGHQQQATGVGSGFVITEDGFIVTNNHVVTSGQRRAGKNNIYQVSFADGSTYEAKLYATDPKSDIAILKIDNKYNEKFPTIKRGSSRVLRRGEFIIALGSPLALNHSATHGIVSCIRHTVDLGQPRVQGNSTGKLGLDDYLQMDIPANQGMSGGPVINIDGEVVGITNMLIAGAGHGGVISYAIPIDTAKRIVDQLLTKRTVVRPYIGCKVKTIDKEIILRERANANDSILPRNIEKGVLVMSLLPGGQAAKAGLRMGDVIVKCENKYVNTADEFVDILNDEFLLKKSLQVTILRGKNGKRMTLNLTPERR